MDPNLNDGNGAYDLISKALGYAFNLGEDERLFRCEWERVT